MSGSSLVKQIAMTIVADDGDAQAKIADLSAKGDELAKPHSLKITADTGEATGEVDAVTEALARYDEASTKAAEASGRLTQVQADGKASAEEVSAAADKNTDAVLRERAAWLSLGEAQTAAAIKAREAGDAQQESAAKTSASGEAAAGMGEKSKAAFLGVAVGIGYAVDQAMKFQEQSTTLVTGAGELDKNLGMVKAGMLGISAATATSLPQVESGLYMIESAGYHGAAGLDVLKAAAEGAKVGNADLGTVADATTTVLTDYKMKASDAASATSGLVAVVAAGKTHMDDLASSVSRVLPTAAALKVPFDQVGGAMATMTSEGTSAKLAAMGINSTLLALAAPSAKAAGEMDVLGMGEKKAAEYAALMASGHKKAAAALVGMGGTSKQVADTLTKHGLTDALKLVADLALNAGPRGSAAYVAALKTMVGGNRGLQVALETTGTHLKDLEANTESVGASMQKGSKDVQGWDKVQEDASFKLEKTKQSAKDAAVAFGDALLPAVQTVLGPISSFAGFLARSTAASTALAVVVGGALSLYLGSKLVSAFSEVKSAGETVISTFGSIASKLGLTKAATAAQAAETEAMTAAQEAQTVATEEGAVAQEGLDVAMDANPIGLIILLVTGLIGVIILVVTHLKDFEQWGKDAFRFVEAAAEDTWNWVKAHWPLLLAILTGPIGIAALAIVKYWHDITQGASEMFHDVVSFFESLPKRILSLVIGYNMLLFDAGKAVIEGLIHGIESMIGSLGSVMGSVAHKIAGFIGLSPALEGPLSGGGAPEIRGQHIAADIAAGMISGQDAVLGASRQLAQATMAGYSGGSSRPVAGAAGSYGGGNTEIHLHFDKMIAGDPQGIAREVQTMLRTLKRRNGGAPLGLD